MKRFKIKRIRKAFVLHIRRKVNARNVWRRLWGYSFATESMARRFADGTF